MTNDYPTIKLPFLLHPAHRILRQGCNRERRIDPRIGGHDRAVHHVQSRVIVHLEVQVYDAFLGVQADGAAAQDVGGGGRVEQRLVDGPGGHPVGFLCKGFDHLVADLYFGGDGVLLVRLGDQPPAEEGEEASSQAQAHEVVLGLHHQEDGGAARPARHEEGADGVQGVADQSPDYVQDPNRDAVARIYQGSRQGAGEPGTSLVAHRLDAGVGVGQHDGGNGDALGIIHFEVPAGRTEQFLAVGAHPVAQTGREVGEGFEHVPAVEEDLEGAQHTR